MSYVYEKKKNCVPLIIIFLVIGVFQITTAIITQEKLKKPVK